MTETPDVVSAERRRAMLRTAMGPAIRAALEDPRIIEIMVNPDGALRVDVLGEGRVDTDIRFEPAQVERIVRLVASHIRAEVHADAPIVSAELPAHGAGAGERFEGLLPPVATAPCFSIRKPAARIHTLADYVRDGIMTLEQAGFLSRAVVERANILVAGGTSSGKTTLANALLAEMASLDERVILIEDTRELQSPAADTVAVLIIITTGLALAFGETAGGFRKLIQIVFGLSIAFAASSFFLSFFSFGGGALLS